MWIRNQQENALYNLDRVNSITVTESVGYHVLMLDGQVISVYSDHAEAHNALEHVMRRIADGAKAVNVPGSAVSWGEYRRASEHAEQERMKTFAAAVNTDAQRRINPKAKCGDNRDNLPINSESLSIRSYNCLMRAGLKTVGSVVANADKLPYLRNLGRKSLEEIQRVYGLELDFQS